METGVLGVMGEHIGADAAFFVDQNGPSTTALGVVAHCHDRLSALWPRLRHCSGIQALVQHAQKGNGVVVDTELFGSELKRQTYYGAIMAPVNGHTTLFAVLAVHAKPKVGLVLGRCDRSPTFTERDKHSTRTTINCSWERYPLSTRSMRFVPTERLN